MTERGSMRATLGQYIQQTNGMVKAKIQEDRYRRSRGRGNQGSEVKQEDNTSRYGEYGYKDQGKRQNLSLYGEYTQNVPIMTQTISINCFKIKVSKSQDDPEEDKFPLQNQPFEREDLWNPERPFMKQGDVGSRENPFVVPNLVPLPIKNHVLNKPQEYHPIGEPKKKKQYRPVVPKVFLSGYDAYLQLREKNEQNRLTGVVDLSVMALDEVVEQCMNKKLLPLDIVTIFLNMSGTKQIIKDFIECWTQLKMHEYDFKKTPFTLLDHRRLSELLLHFFPERYTIGSIDAFHVDEKEFLRKSYYINAEDYVKCYLVLDSISGRNWWEELKARHRGTVHQNYFQLKEALYEGIRPLQLCQSFEQRSAFLAMTLGQLHLQDNDVELQKILTNKFKNPNPHFTEKDTGYQDSRTEMTGEDNYENYDDISDQGLYAGSSRQRDTTNGIYDQSQN